MSEGVDYSVGIPGGDALIKAGKTFAGRYAVSDLSSIGGDGRGISAHEYQDLKTHNVAVYVYWESTSGWMLGGWGAGQMAARNALLNMRAAGLSVTMPIFYACDFDAQTDDELAAIDDCLRGAASVTGAMQVALYAGWTVIDHCNRADTAQRFCQTSAWEYGRGLHPAACLYQYDYNVFINGVNCDLVSSHADDFGQDLYFDEDAQPEYPAAKLPDNWRRDLSKATPTTLIWSWGGQNLHLYPARKNVVLLRDTNQYIEPIVSKEGHAGPLLKEGAKIAIDRVTRVKDDSGDGYRDWLVTHAGTWIPADTATPRVAPDEPREKG